MGAHSERLITQCRFKNEISVIDKVSKDFNRSVRISKEVAAAAFGSREAVFIVICTITMRAVRGADNLHVHNK